MKNVNLNFIEVKHDDKMVSVINFDVSSLQKFEQLLQEYKIPFCMSEQIKEYTENQEINEEHTNESKNTAMVCNDFDRNRELLKLKYPENYIDVNTTLYDIGKYHVTYNVLSRIANNIRFDSDTIDCSITLILQELYKAGMEEIFNNVFYFESNFFELLERKNIDDILQRTNIYDQYMFVIPKHIQIRDLDHWVFLFSFLKGNQMTLLTTIY